MLDAERFVGVGVAVHPPGEARRLANDEAGAAALVARPPARSRSRPSPPPLNPGRGENF